jgi:hypothetical protein
MIKKTINKYKLLYSGKKEMKLSKVAREISTQGIENEISREAKEDEALAASTWNEVVVVGLDLLHSRLDFQVW